MRICVVTSSFPRYEGDYSGHFVYKQVSALSRKHEVHVIYPTDREIADVSHDSFSHHPFRYPFKTYPMAQVQGLDILNIPKLLSTMLGKIRQIKKQYEIDLFYAFWSIPAGYLCSIGCGKTPYVVSLLGSDDQVFGRGHISTPFIKRAIKKAARVIVLGNYFKEDVVSMGIDKEKISIIPTGADANVYKPGDKAAIRAKLGLPSGLIILFVGSLFQLKRVDWLIRQSAELEKKFQFHTIIIGDGPEREKLQNMAADLKCQNVRFLGKIPLETMPSYYAAADVLALFSETEGLPSCIQEALMAGTPVVATGVGAIPDIIQHGETGYIVNNESEAQKYLSKFMLSPELASRMGDNARRFALEYLAENELADRVETLLQSVLPEKGSTGKTYQTSEKFSTSTLPVQRKPDIGVVSTSSNFYLSGIIDVLMPLANSIHLISPSLEKPKIHNYTFEYKIGKNIFSQIFNQISAQTRMASYIIKLRKKVDFFIFVAGDVFLLPVITAKIVGSPVFLAPIGNLNLETKVKKNPLNPIQIMLKNVNFNIADKIIVFSEELIKQWHLDKYKSKIMVVQSQYVDTDKFYIETPLIKRDKRVGYIGRLSPEKGVWNLVQSIPLVLKKDDSINFLIVGGGPLSEKIKEYLDDMGLNDKVTFKGKVPHDEVSRYLNELRLLVLLSHTEGLPVGVLEAFACGTPVLATPVGAIPEIIDNGKTGFLIKDNSPKETTDNILRILSDPQLEKVSQSARKAAETEFCLSVAQQNYQKVMQEGLRLRSIRNKNS